MSLSQHPVMEFLAHIYTAFARDQDKVAEEFANLCATVGPANCTFAKNGSTGASIIQDIRSLIDVRSIKTYSSVSI